MRIASIAAAWPIGPGQAEQPAGAGDEVALDLGQPERRAGRGDDEVGGEDDLAAAGGGQAVDGDDDRLAPLAVDEPGEAAALGAERRAVAGVDRLEVGAGAEHRALLALGVGGEDADPDVVVGLQPVDRPPRARRRRRR